MTDAIKLKLKNSRLLIPSLLILSGVLIVVSFAFGYYPLSIKDILNYLFGGQTDPFAKQIIANIRLPRVLSAFVIGMSLSASGAAYQGVFKNPLVSPDILGVASGCGVGAALAILLDLSYFYIQIFAFAFGILAVFITYTLSINIKTSRKIAMILCGTMIGSLCISLITMMKYLADVTEQLPEITYWLMGSISKTSGNALMFSLPFIVVGFLVLSLMSHRLNVLTLSDDEAKSLGINLKSNMKIVILASTMMCSGAVCLGGQIVWIGLMIPHIARAIVGNNYAKLLPVSALLGGIFLLIVDDIIRALFVTEVPIGLLISFIGAPFFYMLIKRGGLK
jgi:iron complex transport system permease protein